LITTEFLKDIMNGGYDLSAQGANVRLYKTDITLSPGMVTADFDQADYGGYAAADKALVGAPWQDAAANAIAGLVAFVIRGSVGNVTPNTIYGYYLVGKALDATFAGKLIGAVRFQTPVTVIDETTAWVFTPIIAAGQPMGVVDVSPE